jgi:hypothetical protein
MAASRAREAGSIRHRLDTAINDVTALLINEQRSSHESVGGRVRLSFLPRAEMSEDLLLLSPGLEDIPRARPLTDTAFW